MIFKVYQIICVLKMGVKKVEELRDFFKSHNKTKEQKAHSAKVNY